MEVVAAARDDGAAWGRGWTSEQHSGEQGLRVVPAGCARASQRTHVKGRAALTSDVWPLPLTYSGIYNNSQE